MLNEMMNNSMAPVAEVGARQVQGFSLNNGGQDLRDGSGSDTAFVVAMSKSRSGSVTDSTGVTRAVTATSARVGEGELPPEETPSQLDEDVANADADGDGVLSKEEARDAIIKGIEMGVVTEMGKNSQKAVAERMKENSKLEAQIKNGGRRTS